MIWWRAEEGGRVGGRVASASSDGGRSQESRKRKKIRAADLTTEKRCSVGHDLQVPDGGERQGLETDS